ncbi:hypothetical protein ACHWQZ_G016336 [Mnemiopsis leidyi]
MKLPEEKSICVMGCNEKTVEQSAKPTDMIRKVINQKRREIFQNMDPITVLKNCPGGVLAFLRKRGAQQILDSDGYIYSQKKSRDTALTSTKYNPPTKCKCHIYLVPSRQLPHSGYTAPQPLCISNMPKLLPLRTSSYLPPAPRHAEKSPSSSTTGRLRGVLNGD